MTLEETIKKSLDIPVIEPFFPILPPCVTYSLVGESPGLTGDRKEMETIDLYQVDIWDRNRKEIEEFARRLKTDLLEWKCSMTIPDISFSYDNNGKTWRSTLVFSVVREEKINGS